MTPGSRSGRDISAVSFEAFFERWLVRHEHYLDELLSVVQHCNESKEEDLKDLISRVLSHYRQYYEEKSGIAQQNVFLVFSPPWFNALERSFLWIAGFKPSLTFRVVNDSVNDLSEDQSQRLKRLIEETKVSERTLNDELASIHESVASPPLADAARRQGRRTAEEERERESSALETLGSAMESLVVRADMLRTSTVNKVVEILNPVQSLRFLSAVTQLYLGIRNVGLQRQGYRGRD